MSLQQWTWFELTVEWGNTYSKTQLPPHLNTQQWYKADFDPQISPKLWLNPATFFSTQTYKIRTTNFLRLDKTHASDGWLDDCKVLALSSQSMIPAIVEAPGPSQQ